jgi:putative transposase
MPRQRAPVVQLSELQRQLLGEEVNRHQISEQLRVRLCIILDAAQGVSNRSLARSYAPGNIPLIRKWRNRWVVQQAKLDELESQLAGQRGMKKRLLEAMLEVVSDASGRGVKSPFTPAQAEQIVALACTKPSDYGLADAKWSQQLLAKMAVEQGIVSHISQSKICSILKKRVATP